MTPRFELTSQRQKVSRLPTDHRGDLTLAYIIYYDYIHTYQVHAYPDYSILCYGYQSGTRIRDVLARKILRRSSNDSIKTKTRQ